MSLINFLLAIAVCDNKLGDADKEMACLNTYVKALDVRSDRCTSYLESKGPLQMFEDLNALSKTQKDFLFIAAWEMINCDGKPNGLELSFTTNVFKELGLNENDLVTNLEKSKAMMSLFVGNNNNIT